MKSFSEEYLNNIKITPDLLGLINTLSEYKGKEQLYAKQSPDVLNSLLEEAKIESTESSNRIEGVIVNHDRVKALVAKNSNPRGRSEEEVAGYRDALDRIHTMYEAMPISNNVILMFHTMLYKYTNIKAGNFKKSDNKIVDRLKDGTMRVRFQPPSAFHTPEYMEKLVSGYDYFINKRNYPHILLIPLFVLDYLCIHPFSDGNGRTARLLTLLLLYQAGHEVGKYISLERIIEQSKETYYETLEMSSNGWHKGEHKPEPWLRYFYGTLIAAYKEYENRVGRFNKAAGSKRDQIIKVIKEYPGNFSISNIDKLCPQVSRETIRKVMRELKSDGIIDVSGKGRYAHWKRI